MEIVLSEGERVSICSARMATPTVGAASTFKFSLPTVEKQIQKAAGDVAGAVGGAVTDIRDDLTNIFGTVTQCAQKLGQATAVVGQHAADILTATIRATVDILLIPATLIDDVWNAVAPQLRQNASPMLFRLTNPGPAAWQGATPVIEDVQASFHRDPARRPLLFIHGMGYPANPAVAIADMYLPFEQQAKMFNRPAGGPIDATTLDIFLLSWNSDLTTDKADIIKGALESLGYAGGSLAATPLIFAAIMWRELERRADECASYLLPLFRTLTNGQRGTGNPNDNWPGVFTHSLGSYVFAAMAEKLGPAGDFAPLAQFWWSMAGAIPQNAFSKTGVFQHAPHACVPLNGTLAGTHVFYSWQDAVLLTAYSLANGHPAMGTTGANSSALPNVKNWHTQEYTGASHVITDGGPFAQFGGYFRKMAPLIKAFLGSPMLEAMTESVAG
jgi:hypothetical protein